MSSTAAARPETAPVAYQPKDLRLAGVIPGSPDWHRLAATSADQAAFEALSGDERDLAVWLNHIRWLSNVERAGAEPVAFGILERQRTRLYRGTLTKQEREDFEDGAKRFGAAAAAANALSFAIATRADDEELSRQRLRKAVQSCGKWRNGKPCEVRLHKADCVDVNGRNANDAMQTCTNRQRGHRSIHEDVSRWLEWCSLTLADLHLRIKRIDGAQTIEDHLVWSDEGIVMSSATSQYFAALAIKLTGVRVLFENLARVVVDGKRRRGRKERKATRELLSWSQRVGITPANLAQKIGEQIFGMPTLKDLFERLEVRANVDLSTEKGVVDALVQHFRSVRPQPRTHR